MTGCISGSGLRPNNTAVAIVIILSRNNVTSMVPPLPLFRMHISNLYLRDPEMGEALRPVNLSTTELERLSSNGQFRHRSDGVGARA